MKYTLIIIAFALINCFNALAQNSVIKGNIKDADSIKALPGVSVYLKDTKLGGVSNGNGNYKITGVEQGEYTLKVSLIGYLKEQKKITVEPGETVEANFYMTESVSTLPEVTVMTRGISGIKEIPGSAHYIYPKEIEKFSYTDVNRTLRTVPGVNIQEEDGFGLRPNIGLRGTGVERSSKITIMEDGVLMAPAPYAAPSAYYFPTMGRMQGVEILKGSSQIRFGPYTTGGAVNMLSTQIPNEFSGRIHLLGGSFGGRNLHAFAGNSHENIGYMVETFQYSSNGFKNLDGGGNTGFDKKDYLAKVRINTDKDANIYQSLTFKIGQSDETSNETYLGLTQGDFNSDPYRRYAASQKDQMNTEHSQFSLTHFAEFSEMIDVTTTAYRTDFKRNWYKLDKVKDSVGERTSISSLLENPSDYHDAYDIITGNTSSHEDALDVKANNRSYFARGIQTIVGLNFETGEFKHDMDVSVRYHQDQIDRYQWVDKYAMKNGNMSLTDAGIHGTESNRIETAAALAAYLQYKLTYGNLTAIPGIRYENIIIEREDYGKNDPDRTGSDLSERSNNVYAVIPGIGFDYRMNENLNLFAGIHKGFSPPGSKKETKPEESINYELGSRYSKNGFAAQTVIFYNDYSNLLGTDLNAAGGEGTGDLFNGGEVTTKGIELEMTYDVLYFNEHSSFSLPVTLIYTYTDANFENDFESSFGEWGTVQSGDEFPYLANNQFTCILSLEHKKFSVNLSGKYMGEMRTNPGQGEIPKDQRIDSHFIIDAGASYMLFKNVSLFAKAKNITDQVYLVARRPAGLRPGMPASVSGGLKVDF